MELKIQFNGVFTAGYDEAIAEVKGPIFDRFGFLCVTF